MPWAPQVLHVVTHHNIISSIMRGAAHWIWELCVPHNAKEMVLQGGKQQKQSLLPWKQAQTRKEMMSIGRRDSLSLPGLFQSTARYSHEYSFSLAKNSCTTTNTYLFTYTCSMMSFFSSSSRSANWLYSVLLDTEQLDKFKTLTLIS